MTKRKRTEFGSRLRAARIIRDFSQSELAAKANLEPSAVSHFETGRRKPSFDVLRRIAEALYVTTDYLFSRVDSTALPESGDPLFRAMSYLPGRDRDLAWDFIRMLVERNLTKED